MRTIRIVNAFNSGEVSPYLLGRTDVDRYYHGCESVQNFIPSIQGGVIRRPGFRYITAAMGASRLIPFDSSPTKSFVLEFGSKRLRFYTTGGQVQSGGGAYEIATPYDTASDDLWDIKFAQIGQDMYLAHPNHPVQKLTRISDASWTLEQPVFQTPATHAFDQDISGGTVTLTPGATTGSGVTFTASAISTFLTGPSATDSGDVGKLIISGAGKAFITSVTDSQHVVADIVSAFASTSAIAAGSWFLRGSPGAWGSYGTIVGGTDWRNTGRFHAGATVDFYTFTVDPVDDGGAPTSIAPPSQADSFRSIDVGRYIVADNAVGVILTVVSPSHVTVRLLSPITTAIANQLGRQGAAPTPPGLWSVEDNAWTATHGYPRAVAFFQDRLVLAGTTDQPQTVWASVTGDYENFAKGDQASQALDFTINSGSYEQIQWAETYQGVLVLGTFRAEYIVGGGAQQGLGGSGEALTPTNLSMQRQSKFGVSRIQPVLVDNQLIYIQRTLQTAFLFSFDIAQSVFASRNLNIFHDLISSSGFKEAVYQTLPWRVVWFTTIDGNLVGITYEHDNQLWAWHRHPNAAASDTYTSICAIPDPSQLVDQLWAVTKRTLNNGAASYSIELMDPLLNVDCGSHYTGAKVSSISGLGYLQGRSVVGVADGAVLPAVVMGGSGVFTVPMAAADIQVGLAYTSTLTTVRPDNPGAPTMQGLIKRWARVFVRLYNSVGVVVNGKRLSVRTPSMNMGQGVPTQTAEDLEVDSIDADRDGRITITQDQPLPCNVLAFFGTLEVGEN